MNVFPIFAEDEHFERKDENVEMTNVPLPLIAKGVQVHV